MVMFTICNGVNVPGLLCHVYALPKLVLVSFVFIKMESDDHFAPSLFTEHNQQLYSEFIIFLVFKCLLYLKFFLLNCKEGRYKVVTLS
jgi:hypothetical protein